MILRRRGVAGSWSQKTIGYALGLAVPEEYRKRFPRAHNKRPSAGWGTQIQKKNYSLEIFLQKNHLPVSFSFRFPRSLTELHHIMKDSTKGGLDMIVCFNFGIAYSDPKINWGHASIVESVNTQTITLIDPEKPSRRKISIQKLYRAIKKHGKKNAAGLWLFRST